MLKFPIAYLSTAVVFVLMDGAFLAVVGPKLYRPDIGVLLGDKVRLAPALVFYLLYIAGLVYFAVRPSLGLGWTAGLINGVLLGLLAYGTYDLTCYAVMRVWTLKVTVVDLAWGAIASGVASAAGVAITKAIVMRGSFKIMSSLLIDETVAQARRVRRRSATTFNALVGALRSCWDVGVLTVVGPDGAAHRLEGGEPGLEAQIEVHDPRFVGRILGAGDVGFAESYLAGEWDSPDLTQLLNAFCANFDRIGRLLIGNPLFRLINAVSHALNRNSKTGSRRNIQAHYDLGDDFYRLWLDPGLNYSSALFTAPGQDLATAQRNKHAALAQSMDLKRGQSVLEIGCGWGAFAEFAAREYDADVTAITISRAQHDYAASRIQAAGLGDKVKIAFCDYRDVQGQFDRVASIEMFEAVGEAYWPAYFNTVHDRLVPGGQAGLQIITIQDELFDGYRSRPDFIQLHIFPGGLLPSEARLRQETDRAGLMWRDLRRFGQDYADTLAAWAKQYHARLPEIRAQGFDARFDRLWRYYLGYCEAGFRTGRTDVIQLGLAKA